MYLSELNFANHNKAIQIMEDAKEQFPDKEFEIYEVNIDE